MVDMATLPKAEDAAKNILGIFAHRLNSRPGDILSLQHLLRGFSTSLWRNADLNNGIEYAEQQGWVELTVNGDYQLTDTGFAVA
jgi:hypothetical protein